MKIGYIQFKPELANLKDTISYLDILIDKASIADLIVLPELCNSGYNFKNFNMAFETSEKISDSIFIEFLISKAKLYNIYIVSGFNERDNNTIYNSSVLVGPEGYIGKYRKIHLFMNEKDYFKPGDTGLPVFDINFCKIGILICFDWMYPEVWRILALKGAHIICHPSNLILKGLAQRGIPVHSLINKIFIITSNRIGKEDQLTFTGLSTIADPNGSVLVQGPETNDHVGLIDIDISLADNKNITSKNHIFEDRRPEEYKYLIQNKT